MKKLLALLCTLFCLLSLAQNQVDPWNTYQWNKKNVKANNGLIDKSFWFEWWYYKITIPNTGKSYFFVYGIVNPWDLLGQHHSSRAYITMGDFHQKLQFENTYDVSSFKASYENTHIEIAQNYATDREFKGQLRNSQSQTLVQWDVAIKKQWSFNAQGWLLGSGITDIDWYPAQASATCSGTIISGKEKISFTDAPCYQDRNWGKQFPDWWAWIVSNYFDHHAHTTLAIGGGKPTVKSLPAPTGGMFIGLKHKEQEYSFRLNELNPVFANISMGKWKLLGLNATHMIKVDASAPREQFMDLQFMTPQGNIFHDYETLNGNVLVKLYKRVGWNYYLQERLFSNHAGIEYGSKNIYP